MIKRFLSVFLCVCICQIAFSQTRPSWLDLKDRPVYDVRDYGAKPDGVTDCAPAIRLAVAAAANNAHYYGSGAKILFPGVSSKTYLIRSSVNFGASSSSAGTVGMTWEGTGMAQILYGGSSAPNSAMIVAEPTVASGGYGFCEIKNLIINADGLTNCVAILGRVGGTGSNREWSFEKVKFVGGAPAGVVLGEYPSEAATYRDMDGVQNRFVDCQFTGCELSAWIADQNIYSTTFSRTFFGWDTLTEKGKIDGYIFQLLGYRTVIDSCTFSVLEDGNAAVASNTCIYVGGGDAPYIRDCQSEDPRFLKVSNNINVPGGYIEGLTINNTTGLDSATVVEYNPVEYRFSIRDSSLNEAADPSSTNDVMTISASAGLILDNVQMGRFGRIKLADNYGWRESVIEGMKPGEISILNSNWSLQDYPDTATNTTPTGYSAYKGDATSVNSYGIRYTGNSNVGTYTYRCYAAATATSSSDLFSGMGLSLAILGEDNYKNGLTLYFGGIVDPASMPVEITLANSGGGQWLSQGFVASSTTYKEDAGAGAARFYCVYSAYPASVAELPASSTGVVAYFYGKVAADNVTAPDEGNIYIDKIVVKPGWMNYNELAPHYHAIMEHGGIYK